MITVFITLVELIDLLSQMESKSFSRQHIFLPANLKLDFWSNFPLPLRCIKIQLLQTKVNQLTLHAASYLNI